MQNPLNFFKAKWRRPKHKGVSGNFSTLVIITGIVIGSYIMSGGGYPEIQPVIPENAIYAVPYAEQPQHSKEYAMTARELKMRPLGRYTPTPIPTFGPSPTPTPPLPYEDPPEECTETALVFLIDASTSMIQGPPGTVTKLDNVKNAIRTFTQTLPDKTLFGLTTFSSSNGGDPRERVTIGPLSGNRAQIPAALSSILPPPKAATHMRQGFEFLRQELINAKQEYPDYQYNVIFVSDGVPENEGPPGGVGCQPEFTLTGVCLDGDAGLDSRNYDKRHDPTDRWGGTDVPKLIKGTGTDIYSISITNATDQQIFPELEDLMKRIASPGSGYYSNSVQGSNLSTIYNQIKGSACNES